MLTRMIAWWARQMHNCNPRPWSGQMRLKRCSCQVNFSSRRLGHIVSDTLFTKWKVNLNCISTGAPMWQRWQLHHRLVHQLPSSWPAPAPCPQIPFHASHASEKARQKPDQHSCGFSILYRQSSWNQRNKAKRNSAAPKTMQRHTRRH